MKPLSLIEAIDMGEYEPSYLATFKEWADLSDHLQFEYIRKALDIRYKKLQMHYAELSNVLDFSKKPGLAVAMDEVQAKIQQVMADKERLLIEYAIK